MSKEKVTSFGYTKPSRALLWTEGSRAVADTFCFWSALPFVGSAPRGDGQEVLVIPGLSASDISLQAMRAVISSRGYSANAWGLGMNIGPTRRIVSGLEDKLDKLYERQGRPVSLVGWSLGGILAREVARRHPDKVRNVVSLGSPLLIENADGDSLPTHATALFEALQPWHTDFLDTRDWRSEGKLTVPATSVYSKFDGIVPWQACVDTEGPQRENIEVSASHMGMGMNPHVISIVLDRLRQPEGAWQPYRAQDTARSMVLEGRAA